MQCFKVFNAWIGGGIDQVERYINKPIEEMLKKGWRIVNVQSNISSPGGDEDSACLAVSVLFENDK